MTFRGLAALAVFGVALLMAACGGGSGRRGTDLVVTGTGPTSQVTGGETIVFRMVVANDGKGDVDEVRISELVGNQLALLDIGCSASGGAVCPSSLSASMVSSSMPAGSSLTFDVTVQLAPAAKGTIANTMTVQAQGDVDPGNNLYTVSVSAYTPASDLTVDGSGPEGTFTGGQTVSYAMTVSNTGPDPASGVHISDNLGNGLSNAIVACSASGGAPCPASLGLQMDLESLPAGGVLSFTVSAEVNPKFNGAATNRMQVSAETDPDRSDNDVVASATVVTPQADLVVDGSAPADVPAGTTATFVMTVANPTGPDPATAVHLVDTVGSNLTLTGVSCSAGGGAVCPASTGAVMDVASLPVGGTLAFTVTAAVAAGTHGSILNTLDATVTSGVRTLASAVAVGNAYANDVGVTATAPVGPLNGGDTAHFTMTVENAGPGPAKDVRLTTTPSSGLAPGPVVTCVAATGMACPTGLSLAATVASIPAGASFVLDVAATVASGTSGVVAVTTTATAAGDSRAGNNTAVASVSAASPDLGVSQTAAARTAAGSPAVFTAVVSNPSTVTASNLVLTSAVTVTGSAIDPAALTIACEASAGASCPSALGATMTLPALPAGRSLTFTLTLPVPASGRGTIESRFAIAADGDPNAANDSATATTLAYDGRSGSYSVFAADGHTTSMTIDFDAGNYSMNGGPATSFVPGDGSEYIVAGAARLRVAPDLLVGNHDFGAGLVPYVAGRRFGTSVNEAQTQFNLATRDTPAAGAPVTRPGSAAVAADGSFYLCETPDAVPHAVSDCAGGLATYALTVDATGLYTATPVSGTAASYRFYLVRSGSSKILVSAGDATDASSRPVKRWRIGLQDPPALAGGVLHGPSTANEWVTMTLTSSSYSAVGTVAPGPFTATLDLIGGSGSSALLSGVRSDGPGIYVMQAGPLAVAFGVYGETASGLVQIAVP